MKNASPHNVEDVIDGQYFFSNNTIFPFDRRPENLMIIFDDCSFIFHYNAEFDTQITTPIGCPIWVSIALK